MSSLLKAIANAKPMTQRAQRIPVGKHVLIVESVSEKATQDYGVILAADFQVLESDVLTPGSKASVAFFVSKPAKLGGETEKAKARFFTEQLTGATDPDEILENLLALTTPEQPGRGILIRCTGENTVSKSDGKTYTNITFDHVPDQDPKEIAARRKEVESTMRDSGEFETPAVATPAVVPTATRKSYLVR